MKKFFKNIFKTLLLLSLLTGLIFVGYIYYQSRFDRQYTKIAQAYQNQEVQRQEELLKELEKTDAPIDRLGYLFIPEHPSQHPNVKDAEKQHNVIYYSQKDPRWARKKYGTDSSGQIWENGCAVACLAMVDTYLNDKPVTPDQVADWAGDKYYHHGQGTSWSIFSDYAWEHDLEVYDCGSDFSLVEQALDEDGVAIVSVKPGMFTEVGHLMVVRGYQDYNVYINDPNDDPSKLYTIKPIHIDEFMDQVLNFWVFF